MKSVEIQAKGKICKKSPDFIHVRLDSNFFRYCKHFIEDLSSKIIQIFGEGTDVVSRAKNGLENVVELGYTTAEHHPYWGLLHNCSQISKTVLDKWNEDISNEELSEIQWMIDELQNSCTKLQDKTNQ